MTSHDPAPRKRSLLAATLLCSASLALPGCGGSSSQSPSAGQVSGSTSGITTPTVGSGSSAIVKSRPCGLVSAKRAKAIVGETLVSKTEAPLGPTCIFKFRGRLATVTLVVERGLIQGSIQHMHSPKLVNVAGLPAYCGKLGTTILDVALRQGGVLSVTAPCPIAQAFAAQALAVL